MNVLLVDDHDSARRGTADCLQAVFPGVMPFHARCCADGISLAREHEMDLVLLDLGFPYDPAVGLDALVTIKGAHPGLRVVILSGLEPTMELVWDCLQKGASGYVTKGTDESFIEAMRIILSGSLYVPNALVTAYRPEMSAERLLADLGDTGLTPRQLDVLRGIAMGKSYKLIARDLGMSEQTARNHSRPIYAAFNVKSRAALIFELIRRGWR